MQPLSKIPYNLIYRLQYSWNMVNPVTPNHKPGSEETEQRCGKLPKMFGQLDMNSVRSSMNFATAALPWWENLCTVCMYFQIIETTDMSFSYWATCAVAWEMAGHNCFCLCSNVLFVFVWFLPVFWSIGTAGV